jgi:hypothetical protein
MEWKEINVIQVLQKLREPAGRKREELMLIAAASRNGAYSTSKNGVRYLKRQRVVDIVRRSS